MHIKLKNQHKNIVSNITDFIAVDCPDAASEAFLQLDPALLFRIDSHLYVDDIHRAISIIRSSCLITLSNTSSVENKDQILEKMKKKDTYN